MYGETIEATISDIVSSVVSKGNQPIIGGFTIEGDKKKASSEENIMSQKPLASIHADSIAVFKNEKLVTWAEGTTARGIN